MRKLRFSFRNAEIGLPSRDLRTRNVVKPAAIESQCMRCVRESWTCETQCSALPGQSEAGSVESNGEVLLLRCALCVLHAAWPLVEDASEADSLVQCASLALPGGRIRGGYPPWLSQLIGRSVEKHSSAEHPDTAYQPQQPGGALQDRWATTPKPNRSTGAPWRFAKRCSARSIPTPQPASTTWRSFTRDGRLRQSRTALPARVGDSRESARPGASLDRNQPQQPGAALQGNGRLRQSRTALPARAWRFAKKRSARSIPIPHGSLNNLAVLYDSMGDYAKAEPLYRRALAIHEKALGPEHPDTATSLNNLAGLYNSMGDYAKAEPLYRRALAIREKALGPEHPATATSLNNLAGLYRAMGDYAKAEPLYRRALAIREKALGPEHPSTATSLNNLAELYKAMGDYAKAEPLYRRALAIREKALGPEHPSTATSLNNLAGLYRSMGDYAKAEPLYQRALAIREKALGPEHPDTATSLNNLAFLDIDLGKAGGALEFAVRAEKSQETQLGNILSFTSEQQRLAFQETTNPFTLVATLGSAPDIAQAILHNKGVVLDSLLEDRLVAEASKDAKQREVIDQLRAAKQRYTQLLMEIPRDFSAEARQRREAELEKRASAS